jgi:hypothetical protein
MAQQTAVEWLFDKLDVIIELDSTKWDKIAESVAKAKEMDKRQKKRAWDRGKYIGQSFPKGQIEPEYEQDAEEYYTQTYGK